MPRIITVSIQCSGSSITEQTTSRRHCIAFSSSSSGACGLVTERSSSPCSPCSSHLATTFFAFRWYDVSFMCSFFRCGLCIRFEDTLKRSVRVALCLLACAGLSLGDRFLEALHSGFVLQRNGVDVVEDRFYWFSGAIRGHITEGQSLVRPFFPCDHIKPFRVLVGLYALCHDRAGVRLAGWLGGWLLWLAAVL